VGNIWVCIFRGSSVTSTLVPDEMKLRLMKGNTSLYVVWRRREFCRVRTARRRCLQQRLIFAFQTSRKHPISAMSLLTWDLCRTVAVNISCTPPVPSTTFDGQLRLLLKVGNKSTGTRRRHTRSLHYIAQGASSLCYL
jgi:hypothetical protein